MAFSRKLEEARIKSALKNAKERGKEIFEPQEAIRKAIQQFGDSLAVSCSWGSCSLVVLAIALRMKPDITVIFDDTTVEYPQTYAYRDLLLKKWSLHSQYIETKPLMPFWKVWKKFGPPFPRAGKGRRRKPKCCFYCKDEPFCVEAKKRGIKATLTGLRAGESRGRMFAIGMAGQYYRNTAFHRIWRVHPIAFWNREQTFAYLQSHNIPLNEVYTKLGLPRNGCQPCTSFIGWEKQLAVTNPKMYAWIQKKFFNKPTLLLYQDAELQREDEAIETACGSGVELSQSVLGEWF